MVRILAWGDTAIDEAFYRDRLEQAWRVRQALGLIRPDNNSSAIVLADACSICSATQVDFRSMPCVEERGSFTQSTVRARL